ncbi:hypothetical protein Aple_083320 [Acrocarpospora pleiomorpha]|uniref:DUF4178 domain-containing protein n=1 Tax=Acrocarpospora pleiomorpha TaxID=90975 RepID=A0A5M3Y0Z0_9ACTN|nr:DUF4178 domain-containing protein [Acrocarpospora pleiomorpha]GES25433.1 hypothetical protein Aple_083320 [Acrocarpospora pleiomorpha]
MTTAVVLGLSVATLIVVLGAFIATTRQDRRVVPANGGLDFGSDDGPAFFDPRTIKVGDTVHIAGVRYKAMGALHLSWHGEQWTEHLLDDGTRRYQWLSVQERGEREEAVHLEVLLWTQVPAQGMVPAKSMLIMEGVEFFPTERGTVAFRAEGMTGLPDRGLLDFADYRANDGRLLSFQRVQGGQWVASYASPLTPGSIQVERLG